MNRSLALYLASLLALGLVGCGDDGGGGPVCGDEIVEGAEECDDGNTMAGDGCSPICEVEPGPVEVAEFMVDCCLGGEVATCGAPDGAALSIPTSITVSLDDFVTSGATVDYTAQLDATLSTAIGTAIVGATGGEFTLNEFSFDLASTGATPATPTFADPTTPRTVNVDPDGDGTPQETTLSTGAVAGTLTHDGVASQIDFALDAMLVDLTAGVIDIVLTVPSTGDPVVNCALPDAVDTTITFDVM